MKDYSRILNQVEQCVTPVLENLGFELAERELIFQQGQWVLRLYIDRADGSSVALEDCETASRAVEGVLDVESPIPHRYCLEVSSPGLDRPLRRRQDFERFKGSEVEIRSQTPIDGRSHFTGKLKGLENDCIVVEEGERHFHIPLENLKRARVRYPFESGSKQRR